MADPWESAPIVEAPPRAAAAGPTPRAAGAPPAAASWEAAPTVESVLPDVSGRQGGLTPPGRRGAAAVPTAQEAAGGAYAPPQAAPAAPEPTARDRVIGAVEAGIEALVQATGGYFDAAAAGGQRDRMGTAGADAVRLGLQTNPVTGPALLALRGAGGGTGQQMSQTGQRYTENVGEAMANLPPVLGVHGTLAGPAATPIGIGLRPTMELAAEQAPRGLTSPIRAITDAVRRVAPEGQAGSPPPARGPSGRYTIADAIGADGPQQESVKLIVREDGTAAIQRDNGDVIDVTNMIRAGFSPERAIAQSLGDDTSGANVSFAAAPTNRAGATATPGSVGAAGVSMATQRRERAAALGVPLTKGDAERTFEQQRFEKETAKNPELGGPLRERKADQREAIYKRFDDWIDQTGAENLDANAVGKSVTDPIYEKAAKAKQEIRAAYEKADAAGETAELVPTDALVRAINEADASKENAGVISAAERQLVRLGGALRGDDGMLIPGELSLAELNEVRKTIGVNGGKDATNAHFAGVLKAAVDASTEGRGGEAYQAARKLHSTYAAEFKNQGVIRDLIELKKGSTDRKTAMADVFQRSILSAKLEEVRAVKRTLTTAGDKGVQAWNDLRGKTVEWIRDEATKSAVRDERGNPVVSADKLGKAVDKLDRDGRLEEVFGKQAAQQLRDIADIARDVYTSPPDAVNTSNTASVLIGAIDTLVTYMASGGTVPLPAFTLLKKGIQNLKERKIKAKVRYALGPGEPIKESPTRAFEPEPPPAAGPGTPPAPKPPGNVPPAGGQGSLPGVEPAGGSVPRGTKGATKRERELTALRDQVTDPEVRRDIDAEITAERRRVADENRAAEYRAIARATTDPALRTKFEERAGKLAPEPPKPKAEPPEPIPVGEAVELDVHDATLDMVKATAEAEAAWRREHRLGDLDAERAKTTAQALQYDAAAVERAAEQFENSPRAFDREVQRIIDEGEARANQGEQGTGGGEGLGRPAEAAGEQAGARPQQPGPDGAAAAGAQRAPADGGGGSAGPTARQLKEAEASFLKNTEPTGNPITDAFSKKLRDDFDAAVEEYGTRPDAQQGRVLNTDTARELSPDYLKDRTRSADVHEPASAFIKRLYAKKLHEPTPEGRERVVMFSAGGTGAGKTSAINGMGDSAGRPEITYDTNMNGLASSTSKIDQALEAGRDVRIMYVYADPIDAFHQAMGRAMRQRGNFGSGRTVPIVEHVKTHVGARQVINQLRERYKDDLRVDFQGIDNSRGFGNARRESIENLPEVADNGLREKLKQIADEALANGAIDEATHRGFTAQPEPASTLRHEGVGGSGGRGAEQPGAQGRQPDAPVQEAVAAAGADLGFVGSQTSVVTERGLRVPVQYRLADLGNLITSHDDALRPNLAFDANLQPRDRTRMGSEAQIARMENALQPELLAESPKASDGAPIVGPDGIVESGNARTIALRRAYAGGKAEGYRTFLEQNAARFGLKPEDVRAMRQPVLVRERTVEVDRADFARQANESPVSAMSDTEQAKSDAARMPDLEGLVTGDDGQINMTGSAEFIRQFMRYVVSPNEQNQLMTADGRLNQRGAIRIRNAIFSRAYNDPDMVAMMTESTDANVRNILAGMLRAAPDVARLRDLIDAGARSGRDFTPDLVEAVRRFSDAREQGMKVEQALAQGSLIGGEAPPEVARIMRALEADSRAPKRIADMIRGMVDEIDSGGDPRQSSLLGDQNDNPQGDQS